MCNKLNDLNTIYMETKQIELSLSFLDTNSILISFVPKF